MAINFDTLPNSFDGGNNSFPLIEKGWHEVTIKRAEMRTNKDTSKPDYLNVMLDTGHGMLFDIFTESDKPLSQFKLKQFITALRLPLHGQFELKDLIKVITGKKLMAYVDVQSNPGYADRNVVNAFQDGGYKPIESDDELPFNMEDDSPYPDSEGTESY